ncbi:hypothetical protein EAF04_004358 [Stromatinia cepivora]|nr:hypothetical protein EAF04_004358 [Stromatinia cepivora]
MASIATDSELMTNFIAAVPVPAGSHFDTVLDENRRPLVFCLNQEAVPKLQIIRIGNNNAPVVFDLGPCISLPAAAMVQTFEVQQANDLTLYLCVAYQQSATSSSLIVPLPFRPDLLKSDVRLPIIPSSQSSIGTAVKIFMSPVAAISTLPFPDTFVIHNTLDQLASSGPDITRIVFDPQNYQWNAMQDMTTPENASTILDVSTASGILGRGMYVLYKSQEEGPTKLYVRLMRLNPDTNDGSRLTSVASVACPSDARCIASVFNGRGQSGLLIAAPDGLRYLSAIESTQKNSPGTLVQSTSMFRNITSLVVKQDGNHVSIWFQTSSEELGYLRTTNDQLSSGISTLLMPAGQSSSFAPCISQPDSVNGHLSWQMLVSNDNYGNLTLLEQASDSGLWRPTPIYSPSNVCNIAVQSHTVTFHIKAADNSPLRAASAFIQSSSSVSVMYNGKNTIIPQSGAWYDSDDAGTLNFIIPTNSLGSQALNITSLKDQNGVLVPLTPVVFDPGNKAIQKLSENLAQLNSAADLRNAKTQKDEPLFGSDAPDDATLSQAITSLQTLKTAYADLPADGSARAIITPIVQTRSADTLDLGDLIMDGLNWIKHKAEDVWDWAVEKLGDVWHFICKIGDDIKTFVLDCVEKVCEAATWVFEKIKIAWDKVVEWIGFIFSWGDILETKDTISSIITAGVDLAADKVSWVEGKVDAFFVSLLADVDSLGVAYDPSKDMNAGSGDNLQDGSQIRGTQESTSYNWASERMKHGGAGTSTEVKSSETPDSDAKETWTTVFQPAFDGIKDSLIQVGEDIRTVFVQKQSMTAGQFMTICKDVIKVGIETIRGVVTALLKLVKMLLEKISQYGNASINIPIFSSLYELIAQHDLTIFDAVSLVLAIPTTIFMKIITGHKPPTLPGLNGTMLGQIVLGDEPKISPDIQLDFNTLTAGITVSGVMVKTIIDAIKLIYASITEGSEGALKKFQGPSGFFEVFAIVIDMIGVMNALPTDSDLPGLRFRQWVSYISLIRGSTHLLVLFLEGGEDAEKPLLVFDLVSSLVNFGLEQAACISEVDDGSSWKDYDGDVTSMTSVSSGLNAIAAVGYFTAFMFKKDQVEVTAVGMVVLEIGTVGLAVVEGVIFKWQYDKDRKTRLIIPS